MRFETDFRIRLCCCRRLFGCDLHPRPLHLFQFLDILGCGRSPRPVDSMYTLADQIEVVEKSVIQRHNLKSSPQSLLGLFVLGFEFEHAVGSGCGQEMYSID